MMLAQATAVRGVDRIPLWLAVGIACVYVLSGLGAFGLLDNNEGLYAEVAREMLHGGSWVIPTLEGLPYLEKPPLLYYLVAGAFALFGEHAWVARLVPAIASLACLAGLAAFAGRIGKEEAGRLAMLILASGAGYAVMSRAVMPDMLLTALLNGALLLFFLAWRESDRRWQRAGYVLLALAIMAKGFVALALYGLVIGAFAVIQGEQRRALDLLLDPLGLALFLLIAAPWHILASLEDADFAWFYFINEHVLRFLGKRVPQDYYTGSAAYYLPRLLLFLFPWPAYLLLTVYTPRRLPAADRELARFLWLAWLLPLAFFSLSSAKGNYYMVVAMPPLALLIALRIEALIADGRHRLLAVPVGLMGFGLLFVVAQYLLHRFGHGLHPHLPPHFALRAVVVVIFLLFGAAGYLLMRRGRQHAGLVATSLLLAPFMGAFLYLASEREPYVSSRPLAWQLESLCTQCRVYIYKDFERLSALPFYLKRPVSIIDSASNDLYFGQHHVPDSPVFVTADAFLSRANPASALVVVHDWRMVDFRQSPLYRHLESVGRIGRVQIFRPLPTGGAPSSNSHSE